MNKLNYNLNIDYSNYKPKNANKKIWVINEDGKKTKEALKLMIEINGFKNPKLKEALENNDKNYLNYFFYTMELFFEDEEEVYLDYYSGSINTFPKKENKRIKILNKEKYVEIMELINNNFNYDIPENQLFAWYEKLKYFTEEELSKIINKIIMNEEYKPKLATFFKYKS